jgi:hypothetical protein
VSSIDELLSWLDEVINDADLALRDELSELQLLTTQLDEGRSLTTSRTVPPTDSHPAMIDLFPSQGLKPHDDLLDEFPFLGLPNP